MAERAKGIVKWFDTARGYGFIDISGRERDAFVHRSSVYTKRPYPTLNQGDQVLFSVRETDKGLLATNVIMLM